MQPKALPGFRDFYPEDFALRAHIFDAWRTVARRYGFEEWDGPPLESLELYTQKSGEEIVGQLYTFIDKGGREVALRPEMTPTLARVVAARANGLKKPIRWFSIPQLFRYERQQRGRLREHFQLNCDLIGEPGPLGDAEIIALAIDVMRALGLSSSDVRVRLSDRRLLGGILREIGIAEALHPLAYQVLDKVGRSDYLGRRQALCDAGALEAHVSRLEQVREIRVWADLEAAFPGAVSVGQPLAETIAALTAMGLGEFVDLDLTIVRGLAYYTGTVFELFDAAKTLRAICGGGRYDNLLNAIGGTDLPALGFGMGDVVLGELLRDRRVLPPLLPAIDLFVAGVDPTDFSDVLALAHELRDANYRIEYGLGSQPLGKLLKLADARGVRFVLVLGETERQSGQVMLKDLGAKSQHMIPRSAIVSALARVVPPAARSLVPVHGPSSHG